MRDVRVSFGALLAKDKSNNRSYAVKAKDY